MSDVRIGKLEEKVDKIQATVTDIKVKINNGFDKSIKNTENKVDYIDKRNTKEHDEIKNAFTAMSKELRSDYKKILWALGGVSFFLVVGKAMEHFIL